MFNAPGEMTLEYIQNKRNRFMPPIRLYVFISFTFFVLVQIPSKEERTKLENNDFSQEQTLDSIIQNTAKVDTQFIREKGENRMKFGLINMDFGDADIESFKKAKPEQIDSILICNDITPNYFTRHFYKQWLKFNTEDSNIGTRLTEKIIKYFSVALFFLMPLFAFILFLLYWRRKQNYYDYLIFSIHYHSTVFIIFCILSLIQLIVVVPDALWAFSIVGLWIYLLVAMKRNYQQSWFKTGFKAMLAATGYQILLLITLAMVSILGVFFV